MHEYAYKMCKNAFLKKYFILFVISTEKYTKMMQTELFYFYLIFFIYYKGPPLSIF